MFTASIIPLNVEIPETLKLSKFVWPSTSKSFAILTTPLIVLIPETLPPPPPPVAVIVTIPAETADTSKFVEKLIVPAVPTVLPSCFMITPVPDAVTPVSSEPSPTNFVAVTTPTIFTLPVPSTVLLNKSKFPPSWGDRSSTTFPIPNAAPPAETVL